MGNKKIRTFECPFIENILKELGRYRTIIASSKKVFIRAISAFSKGFGALSVKFLRIYLKKTSEHFQVAFKIIFLNILLDLRDKEIIFQMMALQKSLYYFYKISKLRIFF